MNSNPRVGRLLIRWQQLRNQGRALSVDELCADCPELADEVGRQIHLLTSLEGRLPNQDAQSPETAQATRPLRAPSNQEKAPTDVDDVDSSATLRPQADAPAHLPNLPAGTAPPPPTLATERPPSLPANPPSTRTMHGYRLLERLGGGTFGVVYKALSSGGVEVAVKEIYYSLGHPQAKREMEALELIKGLRHPYLLALHDFWVENDRLYMAMELADGTLADLAAASGSKGMFPAEVLPIFEHAAAALDFLHEHHVLHRDVKPANILLLAGFAKVADLGLAKFNPEDVAVSQNIAGTAAYMAPETFGNEFRPATDQYALALCYAEVRLGRQLCEGTNLPAAVYWHMSVAPDLKGLQPHEQRAMRRALSKNPEDRFPSCQEFVRALHAPPHPTGGRWWLFLTPLLLLPILALVLVLWRLWPVAPPPPPPPPPPARSLGFDPDKHGFLVPAGTPQIPVDDLWYYVRIVKKVGDQDVAFLLVPKEKPEDPPTFYVMEDKVWNGLYAVADRDQDFQRQLAEFKKEYPSLEWGQWIHGGVRNGDMEVTNQNPALPVLRVNAFEARCFALWMQGDLPTARQWDRAAGAGRLPGEKIYRDPDQPLNLTGPLPDVAVNRREQGPLEVGKAPRDRTTISLRPEMAGICCRDMAGDGWEWMRETTNDRLIGHGLVIRTASLGPWVNVRGQAYFKPDPWSFKSDKVPMDIKEDYPAIGFRVVVEP